MNPHATAQVELTYRDLEALIITVRGTLKRAERQYAKDSSVAKRIAKGIGPEGKRDASQWMMDRTRELLAKLERAYGATL